MNATPIIIKDRRMYVPKTRKLFCASAMPVPRVLFLRGNIGLFHADLSSVQNSGSGTQARDVVHVVQERGEPLFPV
jgi:hypothetical protein